MVFGLFHHPDDAAEGAFRRPPRCPDFEVAFPVDGAGKGLVARLLGNRHGLAGDGGLVHGGDPLDDLAVHGDLFSGAHDHPFVGLHTFYWYGDFPAVAPNRGGIGCQFHQGPKRMPRPVDGIIFQEFGRREEEGNRGGFQVFSDDGCAEDGGGHQEVHVQGERAKRPDSGGEKVEASQEGRDQKEQARKPDVSLPERHFRPAPPGGQPEGEEEARQKGEDLFPVLPEGGFAGSTFPHGVARIPDGRRHLPCIYNALDIVHRYPLRHHTG